MKKIEVIKGLFNGMSGEVIAENEKVVRFIDEKLNTEIEVSKHCIVEVEEAPVVTITDMKSKGTKYEVTYKGQTISRTTKRTYTHVVICEYYGYKSTGEVIELGFSGRYDLAVKNFEKYNSCTITALDEYKAFDKPFFEGLEEKMKFENVQIVELKESK